ncbi:hypothetical protein JNW90_01405 [Micromonospora sp. STR1s_5]|nr:hypothetical protein [Micromonospora sp. STR1s_5]
MAGLDDGDTADEELFASVEPAAGGSVDDVEVKVMDVLAGSFEERRDRLRSAAEALLGARRGSGDAAGVWVYIVGTWNDRVVATRHGDESDPKTFEIPYTIRDGEVEMGTPEEVEIVATIQPAGSSGVKSVAALVLDDAARVLALDSVGTKSDGSWSDEDELLAGTLDRLGALVNGAPLDGKTAEVDGVETVGEGEVETIGETGTKTAEVDATTGETGVPQDVERKVVIDPDEIKRMLASIA